MKSLRSNALFPVALSFLYCWWPATGPAQDAKTVPTPPAARGKPGSAAAPRISALPDEFVILPELKGVVLLPDASHVTSGPFRARPGIDASQVSILPPQATAAIAPEIIGRPVSYASLERIASVLRLTLEQLGYPFVSAYVPPQDITAGWVQVVVQISRAAPETRVEGAKYFSADHYRAAIRQQTGQPIDIAGLKADIDWLNRNAFGQVDVVAEPGGADGTTALKLRVNDRFPLRVFAGYNNTGSLVSDEDRVNAGFTWGNAFGRGDQLGYQYSASPDAKTSVTHSGNYSTDLPWRHTLSVSGAYSELVGRVAAPFSLAGRTSQVGLRYTIPLRPWSQTVTQALTLGFDFKTSNNNLEFAAFPITNNLTHIAQFTATWDLGFTDRWGHTSVGVDVFASPGGLTSRNHTRYFEISRAGAQPDYVYGQIAAQRLTRLPHGFTWSVRGRLQLSSANLLGSEQMAGGGSASVRGYEEGEAYGDQGLFLSHELALPAMSLLPRLRVTRWSDSLQVFAFEDFVTLTNRHLLAGERRYTDLHSVGIGLRYQLRSNVSLDLSHGWQLRDSGVSRSGEHARTHVSVQVSY